MDMRITKEDFIKILNCMVIVSNNFEDKMSKIHKAAKLLRTAILEEWPDEHNITGFMFNIEDSLDVSDGGRAEGVAEFGTTDNDVEDIQEAIYG